VEKTECPEETEPAENLSEDSFLELILGTSDSDEIPEEICLPQPGYFTVAIDKAIQQDIDFNWWVIN